MLPWQRVLIAVLVVALLALATHAAFGAERSGTVVERQTSAPIAGATVTLGEHSVLTDQLGRFRIEGSGSLRVRAPGYRREDVTEADGRHDVVTLERFAPKALYLTVYGIGSAGLRDPALDVIARSGLNALVIDLKGDRGIVPYPSRTPLSAAAGATRVQTIGDLGALVTGLKARGLYLIARIVVFKDELLTAAHPEWAVRTRAGAVWKDREGLAWLDPFRKESWEHALAIAEEAAASGFDEIQFD
jgi:hypothetical protein